MQPVPEDAEKELEEAATQPGRHALADLPAPSSWPVHHAGADDRLCQAFARAVGEYDS